MTFRNPRYTEFGTIDCEIEHPDYGWIPFTCDPADTGALFDTSVMFEQMRPYAAPYAPPAEPEPISPSKEEQQVARAAAYSSEADPIFFRYQRGEASEHDWLDKIAEIRARYPYPEA